ncbi:MAG: class I SAM-dependent methyltransferase [Lentimicrobium sp.]|nr:class I SAM-dependent methyltransferase [Lentimicrobium sp.]
MDNFKKSIDKQIASNRGKNLFHDGVPASNEFIELLVENLKEINNVSDEQEQELIEYTADRVLQEFCRINQYYSFGKAEKKALRDIYAVLFSSIRNSNASIAALSENHLKNLRNFLYKTNPFAGKIYPQQNEALEAVACSEYTPELQLEILNLNVRELMEPVLDIGCGRQGNLVKYLREEGIEAYGFDRLPDDLSYLTSADWLEYPYGESKWGTIVSNLGFSNHFHHHHLREDGDFLKYAEKYMEILRSLKPGGCFHYAPGLPFIESYLNKDLYQLSDQPFGREGFKSIIIKRLS